MKKQEWDVMKLMISMSKTVIVFVYATLSDVISHFKLTNRLFNYGIRSTVLLWLKKLLCIPYSSD